MPGRTSYLECPPSTSTANERLLDDDSSSASLNCPNGCRESRGDLSTGESPRHTGQTASVTRQRCEEINVIGESGRRKPPSTKTLPRRTRSPRSPYLLALHTILLLHIFVGGAESVRCYCTDDHCVPTYGVCEAAVCLVGIRKPDLAVIRTCGDEPLGCQRHSGSWQDLCACDQPFCNTFSYLREMTEHLEPAVGPPPGSSSNGDHQQQPQASRAHRQELGFEPEMDMDDEAVMFNRFDYPPGEYIDSNGIHHKSPVSTRSSLLMLLLVIVPLSVGAATVMVVSFNYYCHLC